MSRRECRPRGIQSISHKGLLVVRWCDWCRFEGTDHPQCFVDLNRRIRVDFKGTGGAFGVVGYENVLAVADDGEVDFGWGEN